MLAAVTHSGYSGLGKNGLCKETCYPIAIMTTLEDLGFVDYLALLFKRKKVMRIRHRH